MQDTELIFQRRGIRRVALDISHQISYPPEQFLQLLAVQVAQPDPLVEDWNSDVLLFDQLQSEMERATGLEPVTSSLGS